MTATQAAELCSLGRAAFLAMARAPEGERRLPLAAATAALHRAAFTGDVIGVTRALLPESEAFASTKREKMNYAAAQVGRRHNPYLPLRELHYARRGL